MIQKARLPSAGADKLAFLIITVRKKQDLKAPSAECQFLASKQTSGRIITVSRQEWWLKFFRNKSE
jgi:hypothetical protein